MSTDSKTLMHLSGADQRESNPNQDNRPKHEQGQENSHIVTDPLDQKSIANRLDQASKEDKRERQAEQEDDKLPPRAAEDNGNKPSKGAVIDEQILLEEQAELRKKGIEP